MGLEQRAHLLRQRRQRHVFSDGPGMAAQSALRAFFWTTKSMTTTSGRRTLSDQRMNAVEFLGAALVDGGMLVTELEARPRMTGSGRRGFGRAARYYWRLPIHR